MFGLRHATGTCPGHASMRQRVSPQLLNLLLRLQIGNRKACASPSPPGPYKTPELMGAPLPRKKIN